MMKRVGLFLDRAYVDAQWCFTELARQLVASGYLVDLYHLPNPYNPPPVFFDDRIRTFSFPRSKWEILEFRAKLIYAPDRKYDAVIGTPVEGAWLAYRIGKTRKIPFFYLADEIFDPAVKHFKLADWEGAKKRDIAVNRNAVATIALSEARYRNQKSVNGLSDDHRYFIIPNAPSGPAKRLKSNYFRNIFSIDDDLPLLLFIGTISWSLAGQLYETARNYAKGRYHLVFHGRSKGLMGNEAEAHPFIHVSQTPLPSYLLHYAVSSADIGLVLYDKSVMQEQVNGLTGGKLGTYLKSGLPLIAGNLDGLKEVEEQGIGVFWDGVTEFDKIAMHAIAIRDRLAGNVASYFERVYDYEDKFRPFERYLSRLLA